MKNLQEDPNSIHHFEYLSTVNAIVGLDGFFIWSNHDIVSERHLLVQKFRREIGYGKNYIDNIFKYLILTPFKGIHCYITFCRNTLSFKNY